MDKMPTLFAIDIEDKDEIKASKFVSRLQSNGFVDANEVYFKNYINADFGIAFSHIKQNYKKYVCEGGWSEDKFEGVICIIAKYRNMLIPAVFLKYGVQYDDGKLVREIELEKRKYTKALDVSNNKSNKEMKSDEEQELLDYIAKHRGR